MHLVCVNHAISTWLNETHSKFDGKLDSKFNGKLGCKYESLSSPQKSFVKLYPTQYILLYTVVNYKAK